MDMVCILLHVRVLGFRKFIFDRLVRVERASCFAFGWFVKCVITVEFCILFLLLG